ncbi:MAG: hypothetical protein AAGK32_19040, partial [Actinomycetota bacterium]
GGSVVLVADKQAITTGPVVAGAPITYELRYDNTGTGATEDSYVYDFLGRDPTASMDLTGCTTTPHTLVSRPTQSTAGTAATPPADLFFTTDPNPTFTSTWTSWPTSSAPPSIDAVTGLRWRLNSAFLNSPGYYGPNDDPGRFEVVVEAPNDPGSRSCNTGYFLAARPDPNDLPYATQTLAGVPLASPAVRIDKVAETPLVTEGDTGRFRITVTNTGDVDLTAVEVADALTPSCARVAGAIPDLPVGGQPHTFTCETDALDADLANQATATADASGLMVESTDTADIVVEPETPHDPGPEDPGPDPEPPPETPRTPQRRGLLPITGLPAVPLALGAFSLLAGGLFLRSRSRGDQPDR